MKIGRFVFVFLIIVPFIINCGGGGGSSSDISTVKKGTLGLDNSVTVGNALEGYKLFTKKEWKSLSDPQKRRIVEFSGTMDKQNTQKAFNPDTLIFDMLNVLNNKTKEYSYYVQFLISADGKEFSVGKSGFRYVLSSGEVYDGEPMSDNNAGEVLSSIYKNDSQAPQSELCHKAPKSIQDAFPELKVPRAIAAPVR